MGICMGAKGTLAAVDRVRQEYDDTLNNWKHEMEVNMGKFFLLFGHC